MTPNEIERLTVSREWQPVTEATLESALPGIYQALPSNGDKRLSALIKDESGFRVSDVYILENFSDFRLLMPADFTPPERRYRIEGGEYSRAEIMELLGEKE